MIEIMRKCHEVIDRHKSAIEKELLVEGMIEVLWEPKKEHFVLGNPNHIEGVICSESEVITIYPRNIWENHCGLLPEPYNWETFECEIIGVLAHEMRHLWQLKNNLFYNDDAEGDADNFSKRYGKK